jgi:predicted acetylornithine/succinylornithine family transaminase
MQIETTEALIATGRATITPNYAPAPVMLDRGLGTRVWDREGVEYLDFLAGIAVSVLGHAHPRLVEAIREQAGQLLHVSNAFFTEPQVRMQAALTKLSFAEKVFFSNSGTEANEAAIKLARRYQQVVRGTPRFEFVSFQSSFHGRTMGALSATGQPKYHAGFEPMVPGFTSVPFGDIDAVVGAVGAHTAGIIVEPVQGEGGVQPARPEFLRALRELCDREGLLLIFDEVQTGMGRTGEWFAYQHYGVTPDIMTLAKGIAGGVPLGAMVTTAEVACGFERGSHASTFGGNPLATRAGVAVVSAIDEEGLLARATALGEAIREGGRQLAHRHSVISDVRGLGALNGFALDAGAEKASAVVAAARDRGLLINTAGGTVLRLVPPLVATDEDVALALERLDTALASVFG